MHAENLEKIIDEKLSQIDGEAFEEICKDILWLLGPLDIVSRSGPYGKGRDIDVIFPDATNELIRQGKPAGIWWVECKKKKKRSLGPNDISPSFMFLLTKEDAPPPPPHRLLYMTNTKISNNMMDQLNAIRIDDVYLGQIKGDEIRNILLDNKNILFKHFPTLKESFRGNNASKKREGYLKKIFVRGYSPLGKKSKKICFTQGEGQTFELKISNLSPVPLSISEINLNFPTGVNLYHENFFADNTVGPYEESTLIFHTDVDPEKFDPTCSNLKPIIEVPDDIAVQYSYEGAYSKNSIHLPFVGREREFIALESALGEDPKTILLEGDPGTGKSRFIQEAIRKIIITKSFVVRKISTSDTNSPNSLIRTIVNSLLADLKIPDDPEILRMVIKLKLKKRANLKEEELISFLLGEDTLNVQKMKSFVSQLSCLLPSFLKKKFLFVLDDLHHISPTTTEYLKLILNAIGKQVFFLFSYRSKEIDPIIREQLLNFAEELIVIEKLQTGHLSRSLEKISHIHGRDRRFLEKRSQGNPFNFVESVRLLEEEDLITFDNNGKIISKEERECKDFDWPDFNGFRPLEYIYKISIQRFRSILAHNLERRDEIEKLSLLIAAMGQPIRISIIRKHLGLGIDNLIDDFSIKRLFKIEEDEFTDELGIYLIHDRVVEALKKCYSSRKVQWGSINLELAYCLENYLKPEIRQNHYKKISECYGEAGNTKLQLKYLLLYFDRCVKLDYYVEIMAVGTACCELMDKISLKEGDLIGHPKKPYLLLRMGITAHWQRRFDDMEEKFNRCITVGPISEKRVAVVNVFRCTSKMLSKPKITEELMPELTNHLERLRKVGEDERDIEFLEALLQALKYSHLFYKLFKGDYTVALCFLEEAIDICKKYNQNGLLLWNYINVGTMKLFKDEALRNELKFSDMKKVWLKALEHWLNVLVQAEDSRIIEHVIETNSVVGFTRMFLGFHQSNKDLINLANLHFQRSYQFAKLHGHKYWESKLLNHLGVFEALKGNFTIASEHLDKSYKLAQEQQNFFTSFVIKQNIANIEMTLGEPESAAEQWSIGLENAMKHYFKNEYQAVSNYQFRLFLRGLLIHSLSFPDINKTFSSYEKLHKVVCEDEGLALFANKCRQGEFKMIEKGDFYAYDGCYYNTH